MYTINIDILDFLCLYSIGMYDGLCLRGCRIDFKYDAVLVDPHIPDGLVYIVFSGDSDVIKYNVIGIRMIETQNNLVFIVHSYDFLSFFKAHICTFEVTLVKQGIHVTFIK